MMPSDSYRLYQVERVKSAEEIRRANDQAGRLAEAVARLVRGLTQPARPARLLRGTNRPHGQHRPARPRRARA
jgi:hypothetical protein